MTAKEYLSQARLLEQWICSKLEQMDALRSLTQKVTTSLGGERVSHTRNVSSLEDAIIRLMEAEDDLNQQIDKLVSLKMDISRCVALVKNDSFRLILEKRYLCFQQWDRIALDMHYSRRWVLNNHDRAVEVIDKILAERGALA